MKIEVVQLENIRSHIKSTVPFTRGFNCLVGGLGSGKSSVLYSIDFAFFGDPVGRSFDYLLREGADSGRVTVQFLQNGKTYKLTRGLKRKTKGISQDVEELKFFENDTLLASMKTEAIAEQFKAITGLDRDLYREIVWMRQEHLKELLDAAPRERQKRLDELFGLSDYEAAWSSIAEYRRDYEVEKRTYEKDPDVTGMEKLVIDYNRVTEEYAFLEVDLQDSAEKLATSRKKLEDADSKLSKLEEKRRNIEEQKRKEARLQANVNSMEDVEASLADRIEGKRGIIANIIQRQTSSAILAKSHRDKLELLGVSAVQNYESLRSCLLAFDDKISTLRAEKEATSRSLQNDQKRAISLSNENCCPLCQQQLNIDYKDHLLHHIEEENQVRQKMVLELQEQIEAAQRTKTLAADAVSNIHTLTLKSEELESRLNEEEKNLGDMENQLSEKKKLSSDFRQQLEDVRFEIGRFEIAELEAAKTQREQIFRQFLSFESDLRAKESHKKDLLARVDEVKDRIDNAQQKLERVQKIAQTIELLGAIRDAFRSIQPRLRTEFVKVLRNFVQQVLDNLVGGEGQFLNVTVDETYTPSVISESGSVREVSNLSGGERTLLAFAYRLGLGQLIMQSRTGHGLSLLLLDEPTENLGREDGSIERLAEAISRFKAIEQIIAVTHSEAFADKAEHVIKLEKEAGISKISIERGS